MSAYNLNLIQPSNISPFATKPPSRATTPKKYTLDNFTTPSDLPKHTPDRPNLQNYSPHRFRDAASKFQPRTENPPSQHDNSRLYNSNHIPAPRFNPEVGPSIRVLPEPAHLPPTQHKLTGLKPRKGSDNNIGLSNKLTVNIEAKEGFQVVMTQKQRRGSCSNLWLNGGPKKPRMSMFQQDKPRTDLAPISEKVIKKKRWTENENFKMQESSLQLQTNSSQAFTIPKKEKSSDHDRKQQDKSRQRKHSDNQCVKKSPSFLNTPRSVARKYSVVPQRKWAIERFTILRQLGKGAYGRVVLAVQKESGFICAIKILSKRDLQEENMVEQFTRQIKIQSYFKNPNIIKVYGCFDDLLHLYVVMECAMDQRLSDLLQQRKLTQTDASSVFYQVCSAVNALHVESVIHRDLKPQNIILHEGVIKLCDFGWSVYRGSQLRTTFCGTPLYLSPEILVGDSYDESVDVWALGIMLHEIVIGGNPFEIKEAKDLVNILHQNLDLESKNLNQGVREILEACLRKRGEDRPSVKWVMGREWVSKGRPEQSARFSG